MIVIKKNEKSTSIQADYLVNPSNVLGWMGGWVGKAFRISGVPGAIQFESKGEVEKESKLICRQNRMERGDLFLTHPSNLPYKAILHVITVQYPGLPSSAKVVETCLQNLVSFCKDHRVNDVVITGIGTGVGRVDPKVVAKLFVEYLEPSDTVFYVTDKNVAFLDDISEQSESI